MSSTSPMHHRVVLLFGRRRLRPTTTTSQSVSFFATKRRRRGAKKMSVSSTTMRLRALVVSFFGVPLVRSLTTFESLFLWSVLSAAHSRRRRRRRRRRSEKRITTTTNNNNKKTRRVVYGMLHIVDEYNWTQKLRVIETRDVRVFTSSRKKEEMRLHNARKKRASSSHHPSRGASNSRLPVPFVLSFLSATLVSFFRLSRRDAFVRPLDRRLHRLQYSIWLFFDPWHRVFLR